MSLELINYLQNCELRSQLQHQKRLLEYIEVGPIWSLTRFLPSSVRAVFRASRNHLRARRLAHLVVSNPPVTELFDERCIRISGGDRSSSQFVVNFSSDPEKSPADPGVFISDFSFRLSSGNQKLVIVHAFYLHEARAIFESLEHFEGTTLLAVAGSPTAS